MESIPKPANLKSVKGVFFPPFFMHKSVQGLGLRDELLLFYVVLQ